MSTSNIFSIGCFALNTPFSPLPTQLRQIRDWGFTHADITDNTDGGCLGVEFGFTAVASLDANPHDLRRLFTDHGLQITAYCAHAGLLDPAAPWRYGTAQIIKAIRAAAAIGIPHVITTEGEAHTDFAQALTPDQQLFAVCEKLYEPLRVAADHGVKVLFENHGPLSADADQVERLLDACDSDALGLNLDTGNLWLGGGDPVEFVNRFSSRIGHVHWKDLRADMESQRGKLHGCGMATIALGAGAIDIAGVVQALRKTGFTGHTTLEVAGEDAVLGSKKFLENQ